MAEWRVALVSVALVISLAAVGSALARPAHGQAPATGGQAGPLPGVTVSPQPQAPRAPGAPGLPPRDPQAAATGTAVIRGRTLSAETGQPLRRVAVRLFSPQVRQQKVALSDSQGLFEFTGLPAGRYQLMATKGGYATTGFGSRRPGDGGRPLDVADGQRLETLELALTPGGVITGRVMDEFGEPVAEANVLAMRFRYVNGRRRPTIAGSPAQSNDIGQFRLFGLPPGEYIVSATLRGGMMGFGAAELISDGTGYAPTYFPGTAAPGEAQSVQVTAGTESIADIQLVATRVSRISGIVVDSTGRAARGGMITVSPKDGDGTFMGTNMTQIRPDGAFTINGVAPGEYQLDVRANADRPSATDRGRENPFESNELAYTSITVAGQDLDGLRIVTGRGLTVAGLVRFEHGVPPTDHDVRVSLLPDTDGPRGMGMSMARVAADGTFEVANVLGPRRIMVNAPRGWMLKSITYRGQDAMDGAVNFSAGAPPGRIDVVLTSRVTSVTGGVQDGSGRSLADYLVMVFPADPARQSSPFGRPGVARPDQQGRFKLEGLRPGEWLAVALAETTVDDPFDPSDPELMARLRDKATPFELREGESRVLQLALTPQP